MRLSAQVDLDLMAPKCMPLESDCVGLPPMAQVDLDSIKFKDRQREKQRQTNKKMKAEAAAAEAEAQVAEGATAAAPAAAAPASRAGLSQQERDRERARQAAEEEEELAREAALMKKLKRGKITQAEFDRLMGEDDDDDDDEEDEDDATPRGVGAGGRPQAGNKRGRWNGRGDRSGGGRGKKRSRY